MSLPMDLYPKKRRINPFLFAVMVFFLTLCLFLGFIFISNRQKLTQLRLEEGTAVSRTEMALTQMAAPPLPTFTFTLPPTPTAVHHILAQTPVPAATFTPAHTSTPTAPLASVLADILNFRSGPGTNYPVLGQLARGTSLELLARSEAGDWLKVRLGDGREGWVYAEYVYTTANINALQVVSETPT
ncbi:MAG: SH3 domain-containing protein [Anaerolineae bacterium]